MAITINGKEYEEADLDNNVKNSIAQVQNANANIANLQADLLNQQIIAQHHSKFITENLPEIEDGETPTEDADVGSEEA
jgi:translation initiation factor 2B subunit (eIF-2B alpha/beta/delta family)